MLAPGGGVDGNPTRQQATLDDDEAPGTHVPGDGIGDPLTGGEPLIDQLVEVARDATAVDDRFDCALLRVRQQVPLVSQAVAVSYLLLPLIHSYRFPSLATSIPPPSGVKPTRVIRAWHVSVIPRATGMSSPQLGRVA